MDAETQNVTLATHPAAELFPLLTGAEFDSFKADIEKNGLLEPIWLCEGKILDGRNRYRACSELGIEPAFRAYEGESPVAFAWSVNGVRRNLSKSQRAAIAAEMLPQLEAEARRRQATSTGGSHPQLAPISAEAGLSDESAVTAGKQVGVGKSMVRIAKQVKHADPALFEQVKNGEVLLADARRKVKNGAEIPKKPKKLPRAERERQIRELAANGNRADQIADALGFSGKTGAYTVAEIAKKAGIVLPDAAIGRAQKIDPYRIISVTVQGLEANKIVFDTIRNGEWDITADDARVWHESLGKSIKELNWLRNKLGVIASGN